MARTICNVQLSRMSAQHAPYSGAASLNHHSTRTDRLLNAPKARHISRKSYEYQQGHTLLQLTEITRSFGNKRAVDRVCVSIGDGEMVGIIGRSGAGKSTLLRLINRLIDPSEGKILYHDTDVTALHGKALRAWRARTAMIFQQFNLVNRLDVLTNVMCGRLYEIPAPRLLLKLFTQTERALAIRALDRLEIAELAMNRADALSGGQQQRVAIARALMQQPRIVLADEPIASLDPLNAKLVMDALADINRNDGITVLTNLHTLDTARTYCRRIIGMSAGRIVFDGPPEALTDQVLRDIYGQTASQGLDERMTSTSLSAATLAVLTG